MGIRKPLSYNENRLYDLVHAYESKSPGEVSVRFAPEDFADIVDWYDANYRPGDAEKAMDDAIAEYPDDINLRVQKANRLMYDGRYEEAERIADGIVDDEDNPSQELMLLRAKILLSYGRDDEARAMIDAFGTDDLDYVLVANMYLDADRPEQAREWLYDNQQDIVKDEFYYSTLATYEFAMRHYEKAEEVYDKLIDKDPFSSFYWLCVAKCQFYQGNYSGAIESCTFALTNDQNFSEAAAMRAYLYVLIGNGNQAAADYRTSLAAGDGAATAVSDYVIDELAQHEEWNTILDVLELILTDDLMDIEVRSAQLTRKGLCYSKLNDPVAAIKTFHEAVCTFPQNTEAMLYEGREYLVAGEIKTARLFWRRALDTYDSVLEYSDMLRRIGSFLLESGYMEEAFVYLERARVEDPNIPFIDNILLTMSLMLKDREKARKFNRLCANLLTDVQIDHAIQMMESGNKEYVDYLIGRLNSCIKGQSPDTDHGMA